VSDTPKKLGRYEIVRELGKGAMGVVYEGLDPNIGRRVAIKTARKDVMEASGLAEEMMERFLREARAAGNLNHPNIITIYDSAEEDGLAYIAMEYVEGGDLRETIENRRSLEIEGIAEIGATICDALAAAHDQGVIHRDIKPANILTPRNGPLTLADFGIAHVADSNLTQDGAMIGTPHYMSPEQFMGHKVDGRSDLFSVAIILYELLTGEKPFSGEALSTVMHHVIKTMPAAPSELNLNVPPSLDQVVLKGLAKRPAERYVDGRAMAAALREAIKPAPDACIVLGGSADATVIQGAAAEAQPDATVVSGGHSMPVPSATMSKQPLDSTTPSQMLPDGTLPGGAAPETIHDTSLSGHETIARFDMRIIAGGVAAVALVLVGLFSLLGGGGENGADDSAPPVVATEQDEILLRVAGFFARPDYVEAQSMGEEDVFYSMVGAGKGQWLRATVTVTDGDGQPVGEFNVSDAGALIKLPLNVQRFVANIEAEGYRSESQTWDREAAWQGQRIIALAPQPGANP